MLTKSILTAAAFALVAGLGTSPAWSSSNVLPSLPPLPEPENIPPNCSNAVASLDLLWPPNHEYVPISIQGVTDPDGDPVVITIVGIFQDEPVDNLGDGATFPDGDGVGTGVAMIRAERDGGGNGRVYHIGFEAVDTFGNVCSGEVLVGVQHRRGMQNTPIDDGPIFDSTVE